MRIRVACIVEGHGETDAVPVLLRRMVAAMDSNVELDIPRPQRFDRSKFARRPDEFTKAVLLAGAKATPLGGVLVLLDADDDCPAQLGPDLLGQAQRAHADLPIAVVLAQREFESWFLAAAESLRGQRQLPVDLVSPEHPEDIRGAKEWLRNKLPRGAAYSATVDQPALAARMDLLQARSALSFDKLWRDVEQLLAVLKSRQENH